MRAAADVIDLFFLIPGGVGIVATAIAYGMFTNFGFFRHRWITVKWVLTLLLVTIGVGYMGVLIKKNAHYTAQVLATGSIDFSIYWSNIYPVTIAGIVQLILFLVVILLTVIKPKLRNAK
ncbi:MAG: hypothetical protein GXY50_06165 [Syntrophomonadaceae bacterium]|nr:hypothetical protein [Syntrophomonadaceae bacterium]